jgi:uncharacterized protein (DUF427 family)
VSAKRSRVKAMWNGAVLAESDEIERVEGRVYFPPDSIDYRHFKASDTHTSDPDRGLANYYTIEVSGQRLPDAAWFYPAPLDVDEITGYVTFGAAVTVVETAG